MIRMIKTLLFIVILASLAKQANAAEQLMIIEDVSKLSPGKWSEEWISCNHNSDCKVFRKNCQWNPVHKSYERHMYKWLANTDCYDPPPHPAPPPAECINGKCILKRKGAH